MRSRTSFFEPAVFKKTLFRFWPIWASYGAVWMLLLPAELGGRLSRAISNPGWSYENVENALEGLPLYLCADAGIIMALLFGLAAAACAFSHLYSARSAGGYAVLPARREAVFSSVCLATLLPLLAMNVLVFAVSLLVELFMGLCYVPALAQWLAATSLMLLCFYGIGALCAQLTGSLVVLPFVYLALNFVAFFVELIVRELLSSFLYGFTGSSLNFSWLSPAIGMSAEVNVDNAPVNGLEAAVNRVYELEGWGYIAAYAAVGLLFIALALVFYRRRRMESAGDVVAVGWLRPVFKYCLSAGCALALGYLSFMIFTNGYSSAPGAAAILILCMCVSAIIGYFAAEMLIHKSFAVFVGLKRWLGVLVVCALCAAGVLACEYDLFGYESRVPDASEVEYVRVGSRKYYQNGTDVKLREPQNIDAAIALHRSVIEHKELHEGGGYDVRAVASAPSEYGEYDNYPRDAWNWLNIEYKLKNGKTLVRHYDLNGIIYKDRLSEGAADILALQELMNSDEVMEIYYEELFRNDVAEGLSVSVYYDVLDMEQEWPIVNKSRRFTDEEARELYQDCVLPDIKDSSLGKNWLILDSEYYKLAYSCTIELHLPYSERGDFYGTYSIKLTADAARTVKWLHDHDIHPILAAESENYYWGKA